MILPVLAVPTLLLGGVPLGGESDPGVLDGPLHLRVQGVPAGSTVTVHALRMLQRYTDRGPTDVAMHAWAELQADRTGTIDVDAARPRRGSYRSPSGRALLWSAYPSTEPEVPKVDFTLSKEPGDRVFLVLERGGKAVATGRFHLVGPPGVVYVRVRQPGLDGVFAYPRGGSRLPVVVTLHGSEGGSDRSAQNRASQFAGAGFATLALNYFAYPGEKIPDLSTSHSEIPVETIARAREWLAGRPEVDVDRLGVWGVSKGAEFAALAASTYPWIRAVVAVVGSDVAWEGYKGTGGESGTSSWSVEGRPVPYVPLYPVDNVRYRRNTQRYERSRREHPKEAKAAEIPVERSNARFLLLGGGRDQVWASGPQTKRLASRLQRAGRMVETVVFPKAGHFISGTGTFPNRLYGAASRDRRDPDLTAEGAATEEGWERTLVFLRRNL